MYKRYQPSWWICKWKGGLGTSNQHNSKGERQTDDHSHAQFRARRIKTAKKTPKKSTWGRRWKSVAPGRLSAVYLTPWTPRRARSDASSGAGLAEQTAHLEPGPIEKQRSMVANCDCGNQAFSRHLVSRWQADSSTPWETPARYTALAAPRDARPSQSWEVDFLSTACFVHSKPNGKENTAPNIVIDLTALLGA